MDRDSLNWRIQIMDDTGYERNSDFFEVALSQ